MKRSFRNLCCVVIAILAVPIICIVAYVVRASIVGNDPRSRYARDIGRCQAIARKIADRPIAEGAPVFLGNEDLKKRGGLSSDDVSFILKKGIRCFPPTNNSESNQVILAWPHVSDQYWDAFLLNGNHRELKYLTVNGKDISPTLETE
jgi:hypothetical protein